jgi:RNA polymerase-binding transcription factor
MVTLIGDSVRFTMAVIWIDEPEEPRMDAKNLKVTRRRLSKEYENLIKSINRSRLAAEEIKLENTKDEGDLATISHERELLYNLHESDYARLRYLEHAMKAMDRGDYGECVRCGEDINAKRLEAVPWATTCIRCQEQTETKAKQTRSAMVLASFEPEEAGS